MKTCWICFSTDAETPPEICWVSPCRCTGDTQWSHEPCLLTWITRIQAQKKEEGEDVPRLTVYRPGHPIEIWDDVATNQARNQSQQAEGNQENQDDGNAQNIEQQQQQAQQNAVRQSIFQRMLSFVTEDDEDMEEENQAKNANLVKCPQCHTPYLVELQSKSGLEKAFMQGYSATTSTIDWIIPYVAFVGVTYVGLISSVSYGVYTVVTLCGPHDLLSLNVRSGRWNWRHWITLASTPLLLLSFKSKRLEAPLASGGLLTLLYGFLTIRLQQMLVSQRRFTSAQLSPLQLLFSANVTPFQHLVRQRGAVLLGLFGAKRLYTIFKRRILAPLIQGTPTDRPSESMALYDAHYEDYDLLEEDNQSLTGSFTVFSLLKMVVEAWTLPVVASTAGTVLRKSIKGALNVSRQILKPQKHKFIDTVENNVDQLDGFMWSVLGGCSFTLVKDVARLLYNRQKRLERKQMHLKNFERTSSRQETRG